MMVKPAYLIAGGAVLAALAWVSLRGGPKKTGQAIGGAIVDMADGVIGGAVTGAAELVGIPKTDREKCQQAKAEGRTWDASFYCPAGEFIRYLWN
jgi:hypothetical protein